MNISIINNVIGIRSFRIYSLMLHFLVTYSLFWTGMDSIAVSFNSQEEREEEMEKYRYAIAFSCVCLGLEGLFLAVSLNRVTFASVIQLFLDCIGTFFTLWVGLDGLAWATYATVATFCVYFPTLFSLIRFIIKYFSDVKKRSTRPQYIDAGWFTRLREMLPSFSR